jgi:hypothetical protein
MAADEAEVDDVPDQTHFSVKNTATLALQLIKRFRNIPVCGLMLHATCSTGGRPIQSANATQLPQAQSSNSGCLP